MSTGDGHTLALGVAVGFLLTGLGLIVSAFKKVGVTDNLETGRTALVGLVMMIIAVIIGFFTLV